MTKALFERTQELLEMMQEKQRLYEVRLQNSERQVAGLSGRIQTLEQQVAPLRALAMQSK